MGAPFRERAQKFKLEIEKVPGYLRRISKKHIDIIIVLTLIVVSSAVLFQNLGSSPMWAGDEQVYFQWAEHIVKTRDYLTPWAYGNVGLWIGKPPLGIWLMTFALQIFGANAFAARFWSATFGVLSSVLLFYLGKFLFNRIVGAISAFSLLTFSTFYVYARLGWLDAPLTFFLIGSIYFFALAEKSERKISYAVLSGVFFGLALMTKQLAALLIPVIMFFYLLIAQKSFRFLLTKRFILFLGVGLLIFSPWVIYMFIRFGLDFWQSYFYFAIFQRFSSPLESNGGNYLFYVTYLISSENKFWLVLLPFAVTLSAIRVVFKKINQNILLLVWIGAVIGIFSVSQTRFIWYIVPVFPAFALVLSNFLYEFFKKTKLWGILPISALIVVLSVAPLLPGIAPPQTELVLSAENHWNYNNETTVTSATLLSRINGYDVVTGGYFDNQSVDTGYLNIWSLSGQTFQRTAFNQLNSNTTIKAVAAGDVNGDNQIEIVSAGDRDTGTQRVAQLNIWNSTNLIVENKTEWNWGGNTCVNAVALADIDGDNQAEIVTAGTFWNGTCDFALLIVWNSADLSPQNVTCWATSGNTTINSISIGDVNEDGLAEIVVGGYYLDGGWEIAQLTVWNSTLGLKTATIVAAGTTMIWDGNARINSVTIGDVDGDGHSEIVSGGYYYQNVSKIAEVTVWSGTDLAPKKNITWDWNNGSSVSSLALSRIDEDGSAEIVVAGNYFDGTRNNAQLFVWKTPFATPETVLTWSWYNGTQISSVVATSQSGNSTAQVFAGGSFIGTAKIAQLTAFDVKTKAR